MCVYIIYSREPQSYLRDEVANKLCVIHIVVYECHHILA